MTHFRNLALSLVALTVLGSLPARAQDCRAIVNGTEVLIAEGVIDAPEGSLVGRFGAAAREFVRDPLNRRAPHCDGETTIAFMAGIEGMNEAEAEAYCLAPDRAGDGFYLVPGNRSGTGTCARTVCERVNLAAEDATALTGIVGDLARGETTRGVTGESRLSGALLLTGQTGLVSGLIEQSAGALGSLIFASPLAMGAAATTILATGGALYVCAED